MRMKRNAGISRRTTVKLLSLSVLAYVGSRNVDGQVFQQVAFLDAACFPWGGAKGHLTLGALVCRDVNKHVSVIEQICKKHAYRLKISYKGTNRYKIPVAVDLIRYFYSVDDMNLRFMRISPADWPADHQLKMFRYKNWVRVVGSYGASPSKLFRRWHFDSADEAEIDTFVLQSGINSVERVTIASSRMAQMSDLLVGILSSGEHIVESRENYISEFNSLRLSSAPMKIIELHG